MNACFFDMDGTLIDSRADLAATVNHTRRDLGLALLDQEDILRHVGRGAKHLLAHAIPEASGVASEQVQAAPEQSGEDDGVIDLLGGAAKPEQKAQPRESSADAGALAKLFDIFMSHYGEHMLESVTLYPGVRRTLDILRERGWLLGVNTAKPRFATMAILEHFGLLGYFGNAIVAGGDCAEMKPSSLPLRECASRMHGHRLSAYDWMVGDNWTDMQCATNAGIKGAFCSFGFGILRDSRATVRVNRMEDLLRHLPDCRMSD